MGCQCRRDCAALLATHHESKEPWSAADAAACWVSSNGEDLHTSALPSKGVQFWTPARPYKSISRKPPVPAHFQRVRGSLVVPVMSRVPSWGPAQYHQARGESLLQLESTGPRLFLTNSACPMSCNHHGSCVVRNTSRGQPRCICHAGHRGTACQDSDLDECLHRCSGHGRCASRMCLCDARRWGIDCSLSDRPQARGRFAPIFVLPLPGEFGMHHVYQGRQPLRRGVADSQRVYEAARIFLQRLHARNDIVARPEEAALYLVPIPFVQMHGCLWEPQRFLVHLIEYISRTPPFSTYWERHGGADHVFFTTQDLGACYLAPVVMRESIIVSHFGYKGTMFDWLSRRRWNHVISGEIKPDESLGLGVHTDKLAKRWIGDGRRWFGPCYNATKDVVVPPDFVLSKAELQRSRAAAREALAVDCSAPEGAENAQHDAARPANRSGKSTLLFMSGSKSDAAPWYSQGVRQEFWRLHHNSSGVEFKVREIFKRAGSLIILLTPQSTLLRCHCLLTATRRSVGIASECQKPLLESRLHCRGRMK